MKEIWRDIVGYEGLYEVSNLGRVKSLNYLHTGKEQVLKPETIKNGYLRVDLCKDGKMKRFYIHRLVATAFLENFENKPCVNHIDCDRANNCIDNLEWATQQENIQYASKLKRMNGGKEKTPLIAINLITGEQTYFNSQSEAARQLNLYHQSINQVLKGKCKRAGNYFFKYINNKQENTLF